MTDQAVELLFPECFVPGETESGDSEEIDRFYLATRGDHVDIPSLHRQMDYVARSLWDVQKCRVMISNRMKRESAAELGVLVQELKQQERDLNATLEELASQHPLAEWVKSTLGLGLPGFARLMGLTGPLDRFSTPAKLWKFVGMGLVDGEAQTRQRGVPWTHTDCRGGHLKLCKPDCTTDHHKNCRPGVKGTAYSAQGRVVCFQLADSFIKIKAGTGTKGRVTKESSPYRVVYDEKKAEYEARPVTEPSLCVFGKHHRNENGKTTTCPPGHIHQAAMRFAIKRMLLHMWREWKRCT